MAAWQIIGLILLAIFAVSGFAIWVMERCFHSEGWQADETFHFGSSDSADDRP